MIKKTDNIRSLIQNEEMSDFYIDKIKKEYYIILALFPGGAAVAQLAVNQLVVGSNPTLGAK